MAHNMIKSAELHPDFAENKKYIKKALHLHRENQKINRERNARIIEEIPGKVLNNATVGMVMGGALGYGYNAFKKTHPSFSNTPSVLEKHLSRGALYGGALGALGTMLMSSNKINNEAVMKPNSIEQYIRTKQMVEGNYDYSLIRKAKLIDKSLNRVRTRTKVTFAGNKPRDIINPGMMTEEDLPSLGFVPVKIAVPEYGQSTWTTYRHPDSGAHIHPHNEGKFMLHDDDSDSSTMLYYRTMHPEKTYQGMVNRIGSEEGDASYLKKEKFSKNFAPLQFAEGMSHNLLEGVPGWVNYFKTKKYYKDNNTTPLQEVADKQEQMRQYYE